MKTHVFSRSIFIFICSASLIICMTHCSESESGVKASAAYQADIKTWQAERIKRLTSKTGWLSLSGLYWLKQGENTFGSDPFNKIKFPQGSAPLSIGSMIFENGRVVTKIKDGLSVFHQDTLIGEIEMQPDVSGSPTILHLDSLSWFIIQRGEQYGVRLRDSENERLKEFEGIDLFPLDSTWRITARLEPYHPPKVIDVPNILGTVSQSNSPGALVFSIDEKIYRLDPIGEPDDKKLFLIFADQTNGEETYGAGRFLSVDAPGDDGTTVIDFNKAYNPPCAFTPYATCPLSPAQNVLTVPVTAGEKNYGSH